MKSCITNSHQQLDQNTISLIANMKLIFLPSILLSLTQYIIPSLYPSQCLIKSPYQHQATRLTLANEPRGCCNPRSNDPWKQVESDECCKRVLGTTMVTPKGNTFV